MPKQEDQGTAVEYMNRHIRAPRSNSRVFHLGYVFCLCTEISAFCIVMAPTAMAGFPLFLVFIQLLPSLSFVIRLTLPFLVEKPSQDGLPTYPVPIRQVPDSMIIDGHSGGMRLEISGWYQKLGGEPIAKHLDSFIAACQILDIIILAGIHATDSQQQMGEIMEQGEDLSSLRFFYTTIFN